MEYTDISIEAKLKEAAEKTEAALEQYFQDGWGGDTVLAEAASWKVLGWAYIADCSEMDPVTASEGGELVTMTKKFVEAGCKAIAFAEGRSIMLKIQAQKNTERSNTVIEEGHFDTVEESLAWLK